MPFHDLKPNQNGHDMRSAGDVNSSSSREISWDCESQCDGESTTTPQSKPLIYNDFQQRMWFLWFTPRLPTSPISSSVITISANTIQEPRLHPARIILNFTTNPINTNQCSGNHRRIKILDKRTTWILVKWHNSNMLRSQTSISDRLLKSIITQPTDSWSPVNRIEHRTNITTNQPTPHQ